MRLALTTICFFLLFSLSLSAQEFLTYTVKKDDTITSLVEQFNVTKEQIYRFNPDTKESLRVGAVIVIPKTSEKEVNTQERVPQTFKTHKVKRKETLFSLSQKYNVPIDDIKRYNKWLYAEQLKRKDKLRIPVYKDDQVAIKDTQTGDKPLFDFEEQPIATVKPIGKRTHIVQPKEGRFGISRKYGMTVDELMAMNPDLELPIQPGDELIVKGEASDTETVLSDKRFTFYEVKPKENFFRLEQRFNISEDSLVALNPKLEDGLKAGMVIKIPNGNSDADSSLFSESNRVNLENSISNYKERTIALMLPFNTHRIDTDTVAGQEMRIEKDRVMRISLDFYSGVMMALEEGKRKGLSTTLKVFDTEQSASKVDDIIDGNNFNDVDVVIGPLLNSTVEKASSKLRRKNIPVISPLSNQKANGQRNLVQSRPTDAMMHQSMLAYLDLMHSSQNIVIIADSNSSNFKSKLTSKFPTASVLNPREDNFLYKTDVGKELVDGKANWFIVATDDVALLSTVASYLNAFSTKFDIQLFALEKTPAFESEDVSNYHLSQLKFTFPSVDKEFDQDGTIPFIENYKDKHGIVPNRYAVRGYDVTYDALLRLATAKDLYESMNEDLTTEYVENKFNYSNNGSSGYFNNGIYIMQYGENLSLKPVANDQ